MQLLLTENDKTLNYTQIMIKRLSVVFLENLDLNKYKSACFIYVTV